MAATRIQEVREQLVLLERRIKPLEWDSSRNQINEFRQKQLESLKEQHSSLVEELQGLESAQGQ